jgi:hypothetical protein
MFLFKLGCAAHALYALFWVIEAFGAWIDSRDSWLLLLPAVAMLWFYAAASLAIVRSRWHWYICLAALLLLFGVGTVFSGYMAYTFLTENAAMEAPAGAFALIVDLLILTPSALLLWHLLAFRASLRPIGT